MMSDCYLSLRQFLKDSNIFTEIKSVEDFPFLDGDSPLNLNSMLKISYGNKRVFSGFADETVSAVAKYIVLTYSDKWNKLIIAADNKLNLAATSTKVISDTSNSSGTKTTDGDSTRKVSAFNSDELIPDYSDVKTGVDTDSNNKQVDRKEEILSLKNLFDNLPLLERTNIINIVLKDVSDYLTVAIY